MLVDDDAMPRATAAAMLTDLGYDVTEAAGPGEAIEKLGSGGFDAVVCDYLMPGMNGDDLIATLRENQPALPALLVTGFADFDRIDTALARLAKPYRRTDLERAVGTLMAVR